MPTAIHYYSSDEYESESESESESGDDRDASSCNDANKPSVHQEHPTQEVQVADQTEHLKYIDNEPVSHEEESVEINNAIANNKSKKQPTVNQRKHRRSRRIGTAPLLSELARHIISSKPIVFITGAGLSAASGIQTFRGPDGLWSEVIWKNATREVFRKNPLNWYNEFWLKHFPPHTYGEFYEPNEGHEAIAILASLPCANIKVITQNIDGLHFRTRQPWDHTTKLIEAHGRLGLYKCIPDVDSEDDSDSDTFDEEKANSRLQQNKKMTLGSKRKRQSQSSSDKSSSLLVDSGGCKYEFAESMPVDKIEPAHVRAIISGVYTHDTIHSLDSDYELALELQYNPKAAKKPANGSPAKHSSTTYICQPPQCPYCHRSVMPQALMFDETYHSHSHYQFQRMEEWITQSSILVFVGTSFAVTLTRHALDHARAEEKIVYSFNLNDDGLDSKYRMHVDNVVGDVQRTLPELVRLCEEELATRGT